MKVNFLQQDARIFTRYSSNFIDLLIYGPAAAFAGQLATIEFLENLKLSDRLSYFPGSRAGNFPGIPVSVRQAPQEI